MGGTPILPAPGQPAPLAPGEFVGASVPKFVSFLLKNVTPPSPLYIDRDDVLAATVISSSATEVVTVTARFLLAQEGRIQTVQFAVPVAGAYGVVNLSRVLGEGYLLSVIAVAANAVDTGVTYVTLWISRGAPVVLSGTPAAILGADYATQQSPVSWPGGRISKPEEGPGRGLAIIVANPLAGAEWTVSPPASARWQVISWNAQLATSAAVGNRQVQARLESAPGVAFFVGPPSANIPPSTTAQVTATPSPTLSTVIATDIMCPLPPNTLLDQAFRITTLTVGIAAADQWSLIRVHVREWLTV